MAIAASILLAGAASAQNIPTMSAVKTDSPPEIDGNLNDACWLNAAVATGFYNFHSRGEAKCQTIVRLLYDNQNLYLAYKCLEPELDKLKVEVTERDGSVFGDDSVELFIDPINTDEARVARKAFHILMNSIGTVDDRAAGYVEGNKKSWNPDYPIKAGRGKDFWTLELALPFTDLFQGPQMGRVWRMNFCRTRRLKGREQPVELSCWGPAFGGYHDSRKWGYVSGLIIQEGADEEHSIHLKAASIPRARIGSNWLELTLENRDKAAKEMRASVTSVAPSGKTLTKQNSATLPGGQPQKVRLEYEVAMEPGRHQVLVSLLNSSKEHKLPPATVEIGEVLDAYLDRNYYTREKKAGLQVVLPELGEKKLLTEVQLFGADGKVLAAKKEAVSSGENRLVLKISRLSPGEYPVTVKLLADNGLVAEATLNLIKHPPAPKGIKVVKIDKVNQTILVNDQPIFPVGLDPNAFCMPFKEMGLNWASYKYLLGPGTSQKMLNKLTDEQAQPILKELLENVSKYLDRCQEEGALAGIPLMRVVGRYGGNITLARKKELWQNNIPKIVPPLVQAIRNHPALFCYFPFDEPGDAIAEESMLIHKCIKENDPYHPNILLVPTVGKKTMAACDVPGTDNYWNPTISNPIAIVRGIERERAKVDKLHLPKIQIPQTGMWSAAKREMTPMEDRCQIYLCLTHGVKGILWFGGGTYNPELAAEMSRLNHEITALAPVLLTRIPAQEVSYDKGECPIHLLIKDHGKDVYLLAVNSVDKKVKVKFEFSSLADKANVEVMFENRAVQMAGGTIEDEFKPYDRHVYRIRSPRKTGTAHQVKVDVQQTPGAFYMAGLESEKYFSKGSKAIYNSRSNLIYIRGRRNTLASVAKDVGNSEIFSYDQKTKTAICSVRIYPAYKSKLTVGDKSDPDFHEVLEYRGKLGYIKGIGNFQAYNSKIVKFEGKATELINCELDRCRNSFYGAILKNCKIHNGQVAVHGVAEPVVGCEIYDNGALTWSKNATFIDCKHYRNGTSSPSTKQAGADLVFINTEDDYLDKYKFFDTPHPHMIKYCIWAGSLTVKWHLRVEVADEQGKPVEGAKILLDAEGEKYDQKLATDDKGVAGTDITQFFRNKDGQVDCLYQVKVDTGAGHKVARQAWRPEKSVCFKHVIGQDGVEELPY